jgi:hypothetical protein
MLSHDQRLAPLATSGATLVAFVGVCHEVVGARLFPWAPDALGGPVGWHGAGLACILAGLLLVAGTLYLVHFPVVAAGIAIAIVGCLVGIVTAVVHGQFHLFAFTLSFGGLTAAMFHRPSSPQVP